MLEHDPIFEYHLDDDQALAYKLGLIFIDVAKKLFPNQKHTGYGKGNPTKKNLWKYCYKLVRETKGLLDFTEYKFYILAQLQILQSITIGGRPPMISPSCLTGPKAWIRWKIWKKKYDGRSKGQSQEIDLNIPKIKKELSKCCKYLEKYNEESYKSNIKAIEEDIQLGKISSYYALMSPWFKKYSSMEIDTGLYKINDEIKSEFKELFKREIV